MITPSFGLTASERVLPSMALDFTTASLDSRVTFTRSGGTATRVNASGYIETVGADTARFDYDPVTLVCKGLLIEESRTNICLSSETFNSGWLTSNVTVGANVVNSPDGTQNADSLTDNGTSGGHGVRRVSTIAASTQYAASCYVKAGTHNYAQLLPMDGGAVDRFAAAVFDVSSSSTETAATETLASTGVTIHSTKQEDAGNGWFRISMVFTSGSNWATSTTSNRVYMAEKATGNTFGTTGASTYAGTGTTLYAWGAQLEAGAFATSYIPTTTAQVTRTADVATMTGTNFSDWFNASEGTFEAEYQVTYARNSSVYSASDGSINNRITLRGIDSSSRSVSIGVDASTTTWFLTIAGQQLNQSTKFSTGYKLNDIGISRDSSAIASDTSASLPTVDRLRIGCDGDGTAILCGHVAKINYWPQRLIDAELQSFSS